MTLHPAPTPFHTATGQKINLGGDPDALALVFREVMSKVATPVTIVTTRSGSTSHGTTVSAFASLSMRPAMAIVALDRRSDLLQVVRSTSRIGVNVLGAQQADLATRFAGKGGPAKFEGVEHDLDHGLPRLPGSPGWLACDVTSFVDGGDHILLLATVTAAESITERPLVYHGRAFGTHVELGAG